MGSASELATEWKSSTAIMSLVETFFEAVSVMSIDYAAEGS